PPRLASARRPGPAAAPARDFVYRLRLRRATYFEKQHAPQCGGQRHARAREVKESIMTVPNRHAFRIRPNMRQGLCTEVPLPPRLVPNKKSPPHPQTATQQEVEHRILAEAERLASRLGLSRRDFLRSSGGMATSLLAMNAVFGRFFDVLP